jgi:hypothetical protein
VVAQEINADQGELHIGEEKCPDKSAAVKLQLHFLFTPAGNELAAGASETRA